MTLVNDLNQELSNKNTYYLLTITGLKPGETHPIQLRWQEEDGSRGLWSASKILEVPGEPSLPIPNLSPNNVTGLPGIIKIFWNGKDSAGADIDMTKVDHIGIFISDSNDTFVGTEAGNFKTSGRKTVAAPSGTYTVRLASVSASGSIGTKSESVTVTIQGATPIDKPTLPIGLSVASAPFGVTASWTGKYQGDATFGGFKSINIYASDSDLGSSVTSTSQPDLKDNLVGSMTVDTTANKITIGMEVLKQTLSKTSVQLYASSLFFYHVAVNANGLPYQVNNVTTYTRINSTGIAPAKANAINLEEGTISIENLTAGNGQFQSWLRTGEKGGARIELSSANVNSAEAGGYSVLSGFTVYNSSNSPVFRADLAGNVAFGGYTPSDIASISTKATTADGKATQAQTDAYDANQRALNAAAAAATAYAKTSHFNSDGSEIVLGVKVPAGQGAIYSNKATYDSLNAGWYLGYTMDANTAIPVMDVGNIGGGGDGFRWTGTSFQVVGSFSVDPIQTQNAGSSFNYWDIDEFKVGNSTTHIYAQSASNSSIELVASSTQPSSDNSAAAYNSPSKISLSPSGVKIYGIAAQGDADIATRAQASGPHAGYREGPQGQDLYPLGAAGRQRMIIQSELTGELLRGMGVYYGQRTTPPSASTGVVGDLWVSW